MYIRACLPCVRASASSLGTSPSCDHFAVRSPDTVDNRFAAFPAVSGAMRLEIPVPAENPTLLTIPPPCVGSTSAALYTDAKYSRYLLPNIPLPGCLSLLRVHRYRAHATAPSCHWPQTGPRLHGNPCPWSPLGCLNVPVPQHEAPAPRRCPPSCPLPLSAPPGCLRHDASGRHVSATRQGGFADLCLHSPYRPHLPRRHLRSRPSSLCLPTTFRPSFLFFFVLANRHGARSIRSPNRDRRI